MTCTLCLREIVIVMVTDFMPRNYDEWLERFDGEPEKGVHTKDKGYVHGLCYAESINMKLVEYNVVEEENNGK